MSLDANSWRYENMKTRHGINSLRNWEILKIKVGLTQRSPIIAQNSDLK